MGLPSLRHGVDISQVYLGFDEELHNIRRGRLSLVATLATVMCLLVLALTAALEHGGGLFPSMTPGWLHEASLTFSAACFAICAVLFRIRRLTMRTILALDFVMFTTTIVMRAIASVAVVEAGDHFPGIEGILLALVLHGVLVPARSIYTFLLTLVAVTAFPVAQLVGYHVVEPVRAHWDAVPGTRSFGVLVLLNTLSIAFFGFIGWLSSRLLYGLARDAYRARRLGNYELVRELDSGGMGTVFAARHLLLKRLTAVKILQPGKVGGPEQLARFEREVELASQLSHPNTISIYDFGRADDGTFYYAMELLSGWNLQQLVKKHGPIPAQRVVHLLKQIAASLTEAHDLGIVHRDIKPSNVFLTRRGGMYDFVKVIDFGLAKHFDQSAMPELTEMGKVYGTPLYLAPECIEQSPEVDGRADLYAVGGVAYWLLTGRPMFQGTAVQVLVDQVKTPPVPPSQVSELPIPPALERIVLRLLEKRPDDRFASAGELLAALEALRGLEAWTPADAKRWWELHMPELSLRSSSRLAAPRDGEDLAHAATVRTPTTVSADDASLRREVV